MKLKSIFAAALAGIILTTSGMALARGTWSANKGNTWSWQLMTPAERTEHQTKMRNFKTYDECKTYQEEHHKQMEVRAKEKGVTLPAMGARYGCDNMKARGFLK
jgi:hypothetical protein